MALSAAVLCTSADRAALAQEPAAPEPIDVVTYEQVRQVRHDLSLTNRDLAAMGCTSETTELVLHGVLDWCRANRAALDATVQAQRLAQANLRQLVRRINVGPRDEAVLARLPAARQALADAKAQRRQLIDTAAALVAVHLDAGASAVWAAARQHRQAFGLYRYVADLSAAQVHSLAAAARRHRGDVASRRADEDKALLITQKTALANVAANIRQRAGDVSAAEQRVLPLPDELKADEAAAAEPPPP